MKKIILALIVTLIFQTVFNLYGQENRGGVSELKFKMSNGNTISLKRVNYGFISLVPLPMEKTAMELKVKGKKSILFPIVFKKDFSIIMTAQVVNNPDSISLNKLFMNEIKGKNNSQPEWDMKTVYTFDNKSLSLGNAKGGITITGIDTSRMPMKTYNMFVMLENRESNKIVKLYGIISVNPGHTLYNNYKEIRNYLIDLRYSMLSVRFEK